MPTRNLARIVALTNLILADSAAVAAGEAPSVPEKEAETLIGVGAARAWTAEDEKAEKAAQKAAERAEPDATAG